MENLQELKPVGKLTPFAHFCCTIGNLPTSYMISLTYEEQLLWLCQYLEKTVIPAVNTNAEAVGELQNLYIQLKDYVDNYFTNLDVQEEINNKLDEMAESGELEEIIAQYINLTTSYVFDTINDLKNATNLIDGSKARTLGFYTKNDGGGAYYTIREVTNQDTVNNYSLFAITNSQNLVAELFSNNNEKIKISQLGIENDINTILKYAISNYKIIDIDKDITLQNAITIENIDECVKITSHNKSLITCLEGGFVVSKSRITIENLRLRNSKNTQEKETEQYCALRLQASWLIIDNIEVIGFYDAIGMYEENMVLFTKIQNCTLSYNIRSGIYLKSLATAQKNSLLFERNYLNKNGKNADDLSANGDTDIGYGIYISGGLSIKCDSNVYEYNSNCGLYVERGYTLLGFTDINGYYEQNKRTQIILNNIHNAKNVSIIDHSNNRPKPNVSNALPRTDIMFYVENVYDLFNPEKNLNFLGKDNMRKLFMNDTLCSVNNIKAIKDQHINDCLSQKVLNDNNELAIEKYANYQLIFPLVKNSSYKLHIKFKDNVTNPRFGLFPYGSFGTPIIAEGVKTLTNHVYETTFTSNFDTKAMFYQEGSGEFEIDYISLVKVF